MRKVLDDHLCLGLTLADISERKGIQGIFEVLGLQSRLVAAVVEYVGWHA